MTREDVWWPGTLTQDKLDTYARWIASGVILNHTVYVEQRLGRIRVTYDVAPHTFPFPPRDQEVMDNA